MSNKELRLAFQMGVDLHNRVAQPDGPIFQRLRNLILDDQNELVRRPSMEFRQALFAAGAPNGGGISNQVPPQTAGFRPEVGNPCTPLCLWFPPFPATGAGTGRSTAAVYLTDTGYAVLSVNATFYTAAIATGVRRRPQATAWHGRLYIAAGEKCPVTFNSDAFETESGLVVAHVRPDATLGKDLKVSLNSPVDIGNGVQSAPWFVPQVLTTYRGRLVAGNFPEDGRGRPRMASIIFSDQLETDYNGNADTLPTGVPKFNGSGAIPIGERDLQVGDAHEPLIAAREISLQQSGAMNQTALLLLKDRTSYMMTGAPLETPDLGNPVGDRVFHKLPISDGCAAAETLAVTPWGVIWAGHEDVWFLPNSGPTPIPIGRRITKRFDNTPYDMRWRWHAEYHNGWYRLAIMAPGQSQSEPVGMEEQWWLDLRGGPPSNWGEARWFGPQVYQYIVQPDPDSGDILRGTCIMARDTRSLYKEELFALQWGWLTPGVYAFVLAGLDGKENRDWTCEFSPTQSRTPLGFTEDVAVGEVRAVATPTMTHSRLFRVSSINDIDLDGYAATSGAEPAWPDNGSNVVDGDVTWGNAGIVACPGTFIDTDATEGLETPNARSNEIVALIRTMEMDLGEPQFIKQIRGGSIAAQLTVPTLFDKRTWADGIQRAPFNVLKSPDLAMSGVILDRSNPVNAGDIENSMSLAGPTRKVEFWVDSTALSNPKELSVGSTVVFSLAEIPKFILTTDALVFSFWVDLNADNIAETLFIATIVPSGGAPYYYSNGGMPYWDNISILMDDIALAMTNAVTQAGAVQAHGSFSHNMSGQGGPVLPQLTNDTYKWVPNMESDLSIFPAATYGRPLVWSAIGMEYPYELCALSVASQRVPWARTIGKLRIAEMSLKFRLHKQG